MKLEHFGMAEPGDCRLVFTADAEELERAITAEQAAPDAPQAEEDLLTAAVNRTILEGFSALYEQIAAEYGVTPVTDPDFELLAVNRAEGFRAGAQFFCVPPLELGRYTGFVQIFNHSYNSQWIISGRLYDHSISSHKRRNRFVSKQIDREIEGK